MEIHMPEKSGLINAYLLDGSGNGKEMNWEEIDRWTPDQGILWVHLDRKDPFCQEWIKTQSGLDSIVSEALLHEETRPRCELLENGVLLNLRGVNLNAGAEPEDMISIRLWIDENRIISLRSYRLMAVQTIREKIELGKGPRLIGDFIVFLIEGLIDRMEPVILSIEDEIENFDHILIESELENTLLQLSEIRRKTTILRRYIIPQRDVISKIQNAQIAWLSDWHRSSLREVVDQIKRYIEDLDMAREHSIITHDEIDHRISSKINKTMYLLSIVTTIFLPLGLVTGLLGINVAGIPGAENPFAFFIVCTALAGIAGFQIWLFRKLHYF
jgi:zinc transporter